MEKINISFELNEQQKAARVLLIQNVLKDPKVMNFMKLHHLSESFVSSHVQRFADWSQELGRCDNCPGLHACKQKETGHFLDLEFEGILQTVFKPCMYQSAQNIKTAHEKQYLIRDGGKEVLVAEFSDLLNADFDATYAESIAKIASWIEQPSEKGFYLYGNSGVGKTYLASAVLNIYAKQGLNVALVHVPSLAIKVKQSFDTPDVIDYTMAMIKKARVVVFDDIGAESLSGWFRDEILLPLLNYRMEHQKITWFTSNLKIDGLRAHFRFNQKGDDEALKANRLMERIESLASPLLVGGNNRRNK
ncbi:MAG: primosomal protein [Erysipelotrichaceae bacterium]|nr:MAG: primosomal protein [Erysipelotrichaceae bacterium]